MRLESICTRRLWCKYLEVCAFAFLLFFALLFALLSRRLFVVLKMIDSIHVLLFQDTTPNTQLDAFFFCWHRRKHTYLHVDHVSEPPSRAPSSLRVLVRVAHISPALSYLVLGLSCASRTRLRWAFSMVTVEPRRPSLRRRSSWGTSR